MIERTTTSSPAPIGQPQSNFNPLLWWISLPILLVMGCASPLWPQQSLPPLAPPLEGTIKADVYVHDNPTVHLFCLLTEEWQIVKCQLADKEI